MKQLAVRDRAAHRAASGSTLLPNVREPWEPKRQGFASVHDLSGSIDAWSLRLDPRVPRH
jgi:hypothetical protein